MRSVLTYFGVDDRVHLVISKFLEVHSGIFLVPFGLLRPKNMAEVITGSLVLLRGEKSHIHKTGSWYLLGMLFKISTSTPVLYICSIFSIKICSYSRDARKEQDSPLSVYRLIAAAMHKIDRNRKPEKNKCNLTLIHGNLFCSQFA